MKRRVISFITVLAMCLGLCPIRALAADGELDAGLCAHHRVHTEECGYVPPVLGQNCTHEHDESCFVEETLCIHQHTADCYPESGPEPAPNSELEPSLCTHECGEDSDCVTLTLSCSHVHDTFCGYVPEDAGAPCAFVCRVCPIEDLIGKLPGSVTPDNKYQVEDQLNAILALYTELTADEQDQLDLSRCFALQAQLNTANTPVLIDDDIPDLNLYNALDIDGNWTNEGLNSVKVPLRFDTHGYSYTATKTGAFQVQKTGRLYLMGGGTVTAQGGAGVEVLAGGQLYITGSGPVITASTYGLDIASGTTVQLSGGTYTGEIAAIRTGDGNFGALLKPGYAYFGASGNPISLTNMVSATTVIVKECTDHLHSYTSNAGVPTHAWTCAACGTTVASEPCTFVFDQNQAACICGHTLTIDVDERTLNDLVYDATDKTANVTLTVDLDGGARLVQDTDYTVSCSTRTDVGEITVTVTGTAYNGTFIKTYYVTQAQPVIRWDSSVHAMYYNGSPVKVSDLPNLSITAPGDLSQLLQYSYKGEHDADFTDGLPTNAGEYEIKASIPEQQNYKAAETNPCLKLTINRIPALKTEPKAIQPVYNRTPQELVTAGSVHDGAEIEFAQKEEGPYSTDIPTQTNAGSHEVWYRVADTGNYIGKPATKIDNVLIQRRSIKPEIELTSAYYVYDGVKKEPEITVKDEDTVIESSQYTIEWDNDLTSAGTHTATIASIDDENYDFSVTAKVEIVKASQDALKITGKPSVVCYGATVTSLDTIGGSENGSVTWKLSGGDKSTINPTTGVLEVKDAGTLTVTAERTVDNYKTVKDTWTFTVAPKPVTAVVTVADRPYNGSNTADVTSAEVAPGDLVNSDDVVIIEPDSLTAAFDDANAERNKKVTLDSSAVRVNGADAHKYDISYPTATASIEPKQVTVKVTLSGDGLKTDSTTAPPTPYYNYDGTKKTPTVTVTAVDDGAVLLVSDYNVSYSGNVNVGTAIVTVENSASGNYTFGDERVSFDIRNAEAKLTSSPQARVLTYNGNPQDLVTVGTAVGGTVWYSDTGADNSYGPSIPQGTDADTYKVYYMVKGDDNHGDTTPSWVYVTIQRKEVVSPIVTVMSPDSFTYTGTEHKPTDIQVEDGGTIIESDEYTLDYSNNIDAGKATVHVINANGGNYIVSGSATFEIAKEDASVVPPVGQMGLPYNATEQKLITAGSSTDGTVVYSLDKAGPYSEEIPTGVSVQAYKVWYMVRGDRNHNDSTPLWVDASIIKNSVKKPVIRVSPRLAVYNRAKQEPVVSVLDDNRILIADNEYTVASDGDMISVGKYTLTITSTGGNYVFEDADGQNTAEFEIISADQKELTITSDKYDVSYGDTFRVNVIGGSGSGAVKWNIPEDSVAKIDDNGVVTVVGIGGFTVEAYKDTDGSYSESNTARLTFIANRKLITPVVTAANKNYDGTVKVELSADWKKGDLVGDDDIKIIVTGAFMTPDVGTNKQVDVACSFLGDTGNYDITDPASTTASIYRVDAMLKSKPEPVPNLTYNKGPQTLLSKGTTEKDIGVVEYSLDEKGEYSTTIPVGVNADTYIVWYRVADSINYMGISPAWVAVRIDKGEPAVSPPTASEIAPGKLLSESILSGSADGVSGRYEWVKDDFVPENGKSYEAVFIPDDTANYNTVKFDVSVTVTDQTTGGGSDNASTNTNTNTDSTNTSTNSSPVTSGPSAVNALMQTSVQNGTATTVLNTAAGDRLVKEAVENQSENVVIKPEITGNVTQAKVSIPTSTVSRLGSKTSADLTVATPIADVTIPNAALDTLSSAGGAVNVVTEQVENAVTLTLTAGGQSVKSIPGGVILSVPVEDANPGTVAMLVHEDGTRETVRKAVAEDGKMSVRMDGSGTVEIVDNSKEFTDVPDENWAADAVAFASAHELFNGTSETTFSPEQPMSRAMLATVLYNLEGRPEQSSTNGFSDVSSDAWYAEGVSWAAENGITNGYGDGEFGPDDNVTREQFAVMLWKYAESPAADGETLNFTDADQASSYAIEALRWAAANGILNGHEDGRLDPSGPATRAQAAQMLKNFMENT